MSFMLSKQAQKIISDNLDKPYTPPPDINPIFDLREPGQEFPPLNPPVTVDPVVDPCPAGYQLIDGICQPIDEIGGTATQVTGGGNDNEVEDRPYFSIDEMRDLSDDALIDYLSSGFLTNSGMLGYLPSKDTEYGKSKKSGEQICLNLQKEFQNKVFILRLPGIFGNGCKPNYNSVVATFCYNVTTNKELKLFDLDKEIELVYVEDLCKQLIYSTTEDFKYETFLDIDNKYKIKISKLSKIIKGFKKLPIDQNPNDFSNPFIKKLFLTYRSYL